MKNRHFSRDFSETFQSSIPEKSDPERHFSNPLKGFEKSVSRNWRDCASRNLKSLAALAHRLAFRALAFGFHPVNKTTAATGQPDAKAPPGKESLAFRNQKQVCDIRWCVLVPTENRISVTL